MSSSSLSHRLVAGAALSGAVAPATTGPARAGELLPPREPERMSTLPPDEVCMLDGRPARHGAGLQTVTTNGGIALWGKTGEQYGCSSAVFATRGQQRRAVFSFHPTRPGTSQGQVGRRIAEALTGPWPRCPPLPRCVPPWMPLWAPRIR
ncbi:hypothetical protein AB0D83_04030 [Streptomyces decoyicus]|uniref:hypothetical protein n=1 Tax=Streptomyces decoyicus TaxID=249567 RepID=UPI0033F47787